MTWHLFQSSNSITSIFALPFSTCFFTVIYVHVFSLLSVYIYIGRFSLHYKASRFLPMLQRSWKGKNLAVLFRPYGFYPCILSSAALRLSIAFFSGGKVVVGGARCIHMRRPWEWNLCPRARRRQWNLTCWEVRGLGYLCHNFSLCVCTNYYFHCTRVTCCWVGQSLGLLHQEMQLHIHFI